LGYCFANGFGVNQSLEDAFNWYLKSANQGYDFAQFEVGACLAQGKGTAQDYDSAIKWFQVSANQGNPNAEYMLAVCYQNGLGVYINDIHAPNYSLARQWYLASQGKDCSEAKAVAQTLGIDFPEPTPVPKKKKKHSEVPTPSPVS